MVLFLLYFMKPKSPETTEEPEILGSDIGLISEPSSDADIEEKNDYIEE